uniref:ACP phosphodiesterase n=1 Tax=Roseivirga sp. TaxID=1964215 RepID=UPI00404875E4
MAIGNFLGDFVKGNQYLDFEPDIAKGIILHREIDRFTDSHEVVSESKKRLSEKYRHYSGVIVDMFYDHFLADFCPFANAHASRKIE